MLESVLVANRGEIARRIIRGARAVGVRTIAVYSDVDKDLPYVAEADEAVAIGAAAPAQSYRNIEVLLKAAEQTKAQAIHPGYGFLAESPEFARAVVDAGLIWVGPSADVIAAMGDKIQARNTMAAHGVPVADGTPDPVVDAAAAQLAADRIGFPVMVKAAAGGGGMGMAVVSDADELGAAFEKVRGFAERVFGDPSVLVERFFPRVRHIEVQILGYDEGGQHRVIALGERDCSVQRRNQKLAEETPSPALTPQLRKEVLELGSRAGQAVKYTGAGTVECLFDVDTKKFVFLEMNTRLQVEHPITEAVWGIDLVAAGLSIAAGEGPGFDPAAVSPSGHAVELRINAEDPQRFLPGPGVISVWREPAGEGVRVDAGYQAGNTVTPFYDSLLAKVIVHGADRAQALQRAKQAAADFTIEGPKNNLPFFAELLSNDEFVSGNYDTGIVGRMRS